MDGTITTFVLLPSHPLPLSHHLLHPLQPPLSVEIVRNHILLEPYDFVANLVTSHTQE